MARLPNKCLHVMVDGTPCGSPAVRHYRFCYHHKRQREQLLELNADRARNSRNAPFNLPILEDANSIQFTLTQVIRLLAAGQISHKNCQPDALLPPNCHDKPPENQLRARRGSNGFPSA